MEAVDDVQAEERIRALLEDDLKSFPTYGTKFSLQRWLEEYDNDIDAIVPRLRWTLNALKALGAQLMDTSTISSINRHVRSVNPAAEYFPGGLSGYDRERNVVFVQPFGRLQPHRLMETGSVSSLFRMLILEAHGTHQLVCAEEEKCGQRRCQIAIVDLAESTRHLINMAGIRIISNIFEALQLMFPGVSRKVYVINAHSTLTHAYNLLQMVFTKSTASSICFLGNDWQQRLKEEIGGECLPPYWGGTAKCEKPTGEIRMGGVPPDSVKQQMHPGDIPLKQLTTIKALARRCALVGVNVQFSGATLKWYFKCSGGDIDFYIRQNNREIMPRMRLSTQFVPESGAIVCDEPGLYEFCFDNTHGMVWHKTILYKIELFYGS